jgi:hypothetical protein
VIGRQEFCSGVPRRDVGGSCAISTTSAIFERGRISDEVSGIKEAGEGADRGSGVLWGG